MATDDQPEQNNSRELKEATTKDEVLPVLDPNSVDNVLQVFSYLANQSGLGIPITLNVSGLLVSGLIISRDEYMKGIANTIRKGVSMWPEDDKNFVEDQLLKSMEEPLDEEKMPKLVDDVRYIHLKGARVFSVGGKPIPSSGDGFLWRGRINSVDGFSIGQLEYVVGKKNE